LARSNVKKSHAFTKHLVHVFQPYPSENEPEEEEAPTQFLEDPCQLKPTVKLLKRAEVQEVVSSLNPEKSSDYDLSTDNILKELSVIGMKFLAHLFSGLAQRILPGGMETSPDLPHPEARLT
jgi:hypothetical protein